MSRSGEGRAGALETAVVKESDAAEASGSRMRSDSKESAMARVGLLSSLWNEVDVGLSGALFHRALDSGRKTCEILASREFPAAVSRDSGLASSFARLRSSPCCSGNSRYGSNVRFSPCRMQSHSHCVRTAGMFHLNAPLILSLILVLLHTNTDTMLFNVPSYFAPRRSTALPTCRSSMPSKPVDEIKRPCSPSTGNGKGWWMMVAVGSTQTFL